MNDAADRHFGLLIAYVVPGFVCMAGASRFSATVAGWMSMAPTSEPTVGAFLYVAVGSLGAGMVVAAFRWAVVDTAMHLTGLVRPELNFAILQENLDAFRLAVEHNYRYYQFYAGTVLAAAFYAMADQWQGAVWSLWAYLGGTVFEFVLLLAARDSLKRYYERTQQILAVRQPRPIGDAAAPPSQTP